MSVDLYDHQREAIDKLRSGSILCGGVGSGKSRTAIAYFFERECGGKYPGDSGCGHFSMSHPIDLYIITTAKKRDSLEWEKELAIFCLSTHKGVGLADVKVVIDSWNNITKYVGTKNAFFIFDEQRAIGSGSWASSFIKIARLNRWILLSATPGDVWSDYIPVFVANGFYRNRTEFLVKHAVYNRYTKYPKIDRYVDTDILEQYRDRIVVNMPYNTGILRQSHDVYLNYDSESYIKALNKRQDPETGKPIRDATGLCYILRKIVNDNDERIKAIDSILDTHDCAIIFYNFDYELEKLREYCRSKEGLAYSEFNGHKHELIPSTKKWAYLVQYTAGAEGWNCIRTDTVIFYSLNYSYKIMEQAAGRIHRMNTPYKVLHYYYLVSRSSIDNSIRKAIATKKNFNERIFAKSRENKI